MTEERDLTPPREVLPPAVVGGAVVHLVSDGRLIWVEKWDGKKWISFKQLARQPASPTLVDGALVSVMLDEVLKGPTAGPETREFGYPTEFDCAVARHVLRQIGQGFLGESRAAAAVREQIADFLARHATEAPPPPILFRGEVGVGKSFLARLTHRAGPRAHGPFVDFNCGAIPASRFEFELFGYEAGSITGATRSEPGLLERAHHGTLFLDCVTELPQGLQAKLLKMLERRRVRRLGSTRDKPLDVWILTATHQDLKEAIDYHRRYREAFNLHKNENWVMETLYQQLGKLDLLIPPLRQRPDDILLLAEHFLASVCAKHKLPPRAFAADARSALLAYSWPGNVREVKARIARVALRFAENDIITGAMLELPNWSSTSRRRRPSGPR